KGTIMAEASKRRAAPKGYAKRNTDPVGNWTEDEPIHFIPRSVKLMDGNQLKSKPAIIIVGELIDPTILDKKDTDPWEGAKGDLVGVWYRPGMKDIAKYGGVPVFLDKDIDEETGEQRTVKMKGGGKNPMKCYSVQSASDGKRIPISEDTRKESRSATTPFDDRNLKA